MMGPMGNTPGTPRDGTVQNRLLGYVRDNPGCTSRQVWRALGQSSAAMLSNLAAIGLLDRDRVADDRGREVWHYWLDGRRGK